jgi:hypothetical protein
MVRSNRPLLGARDLGVARSPGRSSRSGTADMEKIGSKAKRTWHLIWPCYYSVDKVKTIHTAQNARGHQRPEQV